ncbi:rhodanese family protein [Desulfovibrio sp. SGI.169]|uniref:rhodanese family protein n=1 Tax=Desulfovibrio sp. SGI.169 TaxID=3420561 RepID=UPI003CFC5ABA
MLPAISPAETLQKLQDGKIRLVDIREPDEINSLRVPGAEAAPLSVIRWMRLAPSDAKLPIVFTCNSGNRTSKQSDLLEELAGGPAWQMEGGVSAWARAGLPVERGRQGVSLFRQIQIGAGALVLLGLAGVFVWPPMIWLPAFVGAGLMFAGVTGFCGLGLLLSAMPWNKK